MTQTQDALLDYAYDVLDTHEYGSNEYRLADFYINREASLSAPQAAGDALELQARIEELTDDICSLTMPNRKVTAADMRKKIHGKCKELYEVAYLALMEKP